MFQLKSMPSSKFANLIQENDRGRGWLTRRPFAHRGLHGRGGLPLENSTSAFRAAVAAGYGIELDVQCSADGIAMVFHDYTLERLAGRPQKVSDLTARELRRVRLNGTDDTIPSLNEMLDDVGGRVPVLVEVKGDRNTDGRLEASVATAIALNLGNVAVMSFWPASLEWFARYTPHLVRGLVATTRYDPELGIKLCRGAAQEILLSTLAPDFVAYDVKCLPNSVTSLAHRIGLPVLTWTVRTDADRERARKYADNIIFEKS